MQVKKDIYILSIESSCDDTCASVVKNNEVLSNIKFNQEQIHNLFGGTIPEFASREHESKILYVVEVALKEADLNKSKINAIAFTQGPGLFGSLLVGASFAKSLSLALSVPLINVNHLHGHSICHFIKNNKDTYPSFPFLSLLVSGGNTQIIKVNSYLDLQLIGQTLDDAAGEAFDKVSKMLNLGYPGGPLIDKISNNGNPLAFKFTIPKVKGYDFSFSGIKTNFLYFIQSKSKEFISNNMSDICASIQHTIVETLMRKLEFVVKNTQIKEVAISGGVSANSYLRKRILEKTKWNVYMPNLEYADDNAAMIGIVAYYKYINKDFAVGFPKVDSRLKHY